MRGEDELDRAAAVLGRELTASLEGFAVTVARSRWTADPVDLYRAGKEALLAANVGEAEGRELIAFEETGAYRLLLPAMSEDPAELERFYEETVAPLVAYDDQYETDLLATVETFLDNDGNVTPTAESLFTHRHTVRYRLERVKELAGHDIFSTEGRRSSASGSRRCGCWGSHRRAARRPSPEPRPARFVARATTDCAGGAPLRGLARARGGALFLPVNRDHMVLGCRRAIPDLHWVTPLFWGVV